MSTNNENAMDILLDKDFRIYRCYQLALFTAAHRDSLSALVANYLYIKYSHDETRYNKAEDIKVVSDSAQLNLQGTQVSYLSLKHSLSTQVVVFLEHNYQHIALVRSSTPLFLVQALESLDFETPLILSPLQLSSTSLQACFDGLINLLPLKQIGNVEFTFAPPKPLTANSLKEIIVDVPSEDMQELTSKAGNDLKPIERVFSWLASSTTLKFENLELRGLRSGLLALSRDKCKLAGNISEETVSKVLAATIDSIL